MKINRAISLAAVTALASVSACADDAEVCYEQSGYACIWAGTGDLAFNGDGLWREDTALYWPVDLAFAPDGVAWVLDWNNHAVRTIQLNGAFHTVVGDGFVGDGPPAQDDLEPPGVPGQTVRLNHPTDVGFLPDGNVIFTAWHNHKLRVVDPDTELSFVLSGRGAGFIGEGTSVETARYNQPSSLAVSPDGVIYVLDQRNQRVRRVADGVIETLAGTGQPGFSGDGDLAAEAQFSFETGPNPEPSGALALAGRYLYVADSLNHRIRRIDLESGMIESVAGTGDEGNAGDGGPATEASLNNPRDIEIGPDGRLYIADTENHRIRVVDLATGVIDGFAGSGERGVEGDGLPKEQIQLRRPFGIAFDSAGALYIADSFNSRILKVPR